MLRERVAHRYSRTLFGMYPRGRRGETSRRGESFASALDGAGRNFSFRRSDVAKLVEVDGAPLVDTEALHAMIRLFRVVQVSVYDIKQCSETWLVYFLFMVLNLLQPLYKGQLQRLLLNICAHSETRIALVKILMDLLMIDVRKSASGFTAAEPQYRLYGCQSNVMYSRPQSFDGKTT